LLDYMGIKKGIGDCLDSFCERKMTAGGRPGHSQFQELTENCLSANTILEKLHYGYALQKIIWDGSGQPCDYVILDMNRAFSRLTGISQDEVGKPITQALPGIEQEPENWFEKCTRVAANGEELEFEAFSNVLEKWFHVVAYSPKTEYFITLFTDISGRKIAEQKLKRQEMKFRVLFERSHDAIFLVDSATGRYLDENKSAENLTGRTIEELKNLRTTDLTPNDAKKRLRALNNEEDFIDFGEVEYVQPDGSKRIAHLTSIQLDENRVFGVARDITDERFSYQRYKTILQTTQDGYWISDEKGNILEVNGELCNILGYSREELLLKTIADLDIYEDEQQVQKHIRELKEIGSLQFETKHFHKQGHLIDVEVSATYLSEYGNRFVVFIHDISERKSMIRRLQESETRFKSLINSMHDIVFTLNRAHRYTGIYGHWPEDAVYLPENFLGRTARDIFGPERAKVHEEAVEKAICGEHVVYEWEFPGPDPSYVQISLSPLETDREITGVVGIGRDVTDKKLAIQELKESKERLQLAVDASKIGLWDWNIRTGATSFNGEWHYLIGYTRDEMDTSLPRLWEELVHPDDIQRSEHSMQEHFKGGTEHYNCEFRLRHKEGHWIWVNSRGKVVEWSKKGEPLRMIGTHTEITETKNREQRKEQQIAHFQQILGPLDQGIGILDNGSRITYINQAAAKLFGHSAGHLLGKHITSLISESDWNELLQAFLELQTKAYDDNEPVKLTLESLEILQASTPIEAYIWPVNDTSGLNGALIKLGSTHTNPESPCEIPDAADVLTLCASCRQIKNEEKEWVTLESFLEREYETLVSHGLCPDCLQSLLQKPQ